MHPLSCRYFSHSPKRNGRRYICSVMRLCRPPWFLTSLLTIQEVAEPQAINMMSSRCAAHAFQKYSSASTKELFGVSIQGISSKKITLRLFLGLRSIKVRSSLNASSQLLRAGAYGESLNNFSCMANRASCFSCFCLLAPTNEKVNLSAITLFTKKVLPIRRRPYTITNSDFPERYFRSKVSIS